MAGLHALCLLKRPRTSWYLCIQKPSDDRVLKNFCFPLVQLVIFSGKSKPRSSQGVDSENPELAPLACDLYCSKGHTLRRDPTSALSVLKCLIFLEQGVPHVCFVSHTFIFPGSCKLGSWSSAPSGMLMRKERYPPSFSSLPYQIHKQIILLFPPTCFLFSSTSLPPHSPL